MSTITYRGQLPIGEQNKLHLSTNKGLVGYRIKEFKIISNNPATDTNELIAKIFLTDQTGLITDTINFNDPGLLGVIYQKNEQNASQTAIGELIIFDQEVFNQDIYVYIVDGSGGTDPVNYYIALEKISLDLNASTVSTLKNIRQSKADTL